MRAMQRLNPREGLLHYSRAERDPKRGPIPTGRSAQALTRRSLVISDGEPTRSGGPQ